MKKGIVIKLVGCVLLLCTSVFSYAKDTITLTNLTPTVRDIDASSTEMVCSLPEGSVVVVYSYGGFLNSSFLMGECIKNRKLKVGIVMALSSASIVPLFSDEVCIHENGVIGTHTPYVTDEEGKPKPNNLVEIRDVLSAVLFNLHTHAGVSLNSSLAYVSYMFLVPSVDMGKIMNEDYALLLGKKYSGVCKIDTTEESSK